MCFFATATLASTVRSSIAPAGVKSKTYLLFNLFFFIFFTVILKFFKNDLGCIVF